jgi:hypothetical protein
MTVSKHNISASLTQILDPYVRQARLFPALLVILPIVLLLLVWFPSLWSLWGMLLSAATSCGAILLLSQIGRDRGKQREPELYAAWDGKPSVSLLRHRDTRIAEHTKARYRQFLAHELHDLHLPTLEEERADPHNADGAYESVTAWLLTRTRDIDKFGLLFRENINYGFRRNLWGLKPLGLILSICAAVANTAVISYQFQTTHEVPTASTIIITAVAWLFPLFWASVVTPSWVRLPADAYAAQLLAACDTLSSAIVPVTPKRRRA